MRGISLSEENLFPIINTDILLNIFISKFKSTAVYTKINNSQCVTEHDRIYVSSSYL